MKTETQQLIIVIVGIIAVACILKDHFSLTEGIAFGLIGFLSQKSLTDKQSEEIDEMYSNKYGTIKEEEE